LSNETLDNPTAVFYKALNDHKETTMARSRDDFKSRTNKRYDSMLRRCYVPSDKSYKNYGERGIKVCSAWLKSIEAFREWVVQEIKTKNISEEDYLAKRKYQIDRIDRDGPYSPDNCRIVTTQENARNRFKGRVLISDEGDRIVFGEPTPA
jgi:hypothetical protein